MREAGDQVIHAASRDLLSVVTPFGLLFAELLAVVIENMRNPNNKTRAVAAVMVCLLANSERATPILGCSSRFNFNIAQ